MDNKVYSPIVIADIPFPQAGTPTDQTTSQTSNNQIVTPATIQDQNFPQPMIAREVISTALNTRSKKIIAEFQFTPSGALQIGTLTPGVSGDIRISPSGIVARDQSGNTTFALDGDSGDAVFAGNLQSGTLVTGQMLMGPEGSIIIGNAATGQTLIDSQGIISATSFPVSSLQESSSQSFVNTSLADIPGQGSITLKLLRSTQAIVFLTVNGSSEQVTGGVSLSGRTTYQVTSDIDHGIVSLYYDSALDASGGDHENIISKPYTAFRGFTMSPGTHTIKLQSMLSNVVNLRSIMNNFKISIILLGK
jgi:hypothetical protein